jgi:hypothetical protein
VLTDAAIGPSLSDEILIALAHEPVLVFSSRWAANRRNDRAIATANGISSGAPRQARKAGSVNSSCKAVISIDGGLVRG